MAVSSKKFQAPKGTRDFYPQDMAVRRYIESVWRTVSINHGFDEIDGPTFEHIDLYTHKSGPGIASELFQVFSGKDEAEIAQLKNTGQAPFALRPEFTPTLARMVAAKANSLPMPIKWFAIPSHFRAERPQRGRLREFGQWNVDFIGDDSPKADAEILATAIKALERLGLTEKDIKVGVSHRQAIRDTLTVFGVPQSNVSDAIEAIDRQQELGMEKFLNRLHALGLPHQNEVGFVRHMAHKFNLSSLREVSGGSQKESLLALESLFSVMNGLELSQWIIGDLNIVRGLAYYTGTVFEIHETTGAERAIAGGGRYDNLIESFGGPKLPACGFGMGDVVLGNLLHDKGLLPEEVYMEPLRPHAFVIAADDDVAVKLPTIVASLRRDGFHIRHSYKTTRNVGKLLGEAGKSRARFAIILGKELAENNVVVKNLETGEQGEPVAVAKLVEFLRAPP